MGGGGGCHSDVETVWRTADLKPHTSQHWPVSTGTMSNQIRVRVNCVSMNNMRRGQKVRKQKETEWDR